MGDKAEEVAQARSDAAAADAARAEAEQAAAAAQAAADQAAAALSRAERKLVLLTKERDGLKGILASYDEEYLNQQGGQTDATREDSPQLAGQLGGLAGRAARPGRRRLARQAASVCRASQASG